MEVAPLSKLNHGIDKCEHKKIDGRLVENLTVAPGGHGRAPTLYVKALCQHEVLGVVNPSPSFDQWFLGCHTVVHHLKGKGGPSLH